MTADVATATASATETDRVLPALDERPSASDCIVVGAGIFGCAVAYAMAEDGRRVLLLERDLSEPDRIVGEYLQPGGVRALQSLGLADCLDDIDAQASDGYGVFYADKSVHLSYKTLNNVITSPSSPLQGRSFHHGRFIQKLRAACKSQPNITVVEATVTELLADLADIDRVIGAKCSIKNQNEPVQFFAPLTIVADGCFSKFRKQISENDVKISSYFVGVVLKDCPLPMPGHGHVFLADPSPILLYQIGTNDTRILVDVQGKVPSASSGALEKYMLDKVMPQLPEQVRESFRHAVMTDRMRSMPNSYLTASKQRRPGVIMLGDALNMRHPLTGGGMTVAFNDAALLRELIHPSNIKDFSDTDAVQSALTTFYRRRKAYSGVINVLAQALYALFSGANEELAYLREACFEYFRLGGICQSHPIGLLSGLIQSPLVLTLHFFAVAIYSMLLLMLTPVTVISEMMHAPKHFRQIVGVKDAGFWASAVAVSLPFNVLKAVRVLSVACSVIFPLLWSELRL